MGSGLARIVCLLAAPLALCGGIVAASAGECPGNPDALGTSRTIVVDPRDHIRIGTMDYAETLPLADREVVLTFDDGPIPPYTTRVLDILAAECVHATYFIVGEMAKEYPALVRRAYDAGHTIGTHSMNHPHPLPGAVGRARQCPDRQRHRGDRGGARRCRQGRAVLPLSGLRPHRGRPRARRRARPDGLGRRRAGRRLAQARSARGGPPRDAAARRQGQGHPAAARHPSADGGGAADHSRRAEGARLPHRPCRAGERRASRDRHRGGGLAAALAADCSPLRSS